MADNEGQSTDTVSREAHERVVRERDSYREQLDKATGALAGRSKQDKARDYFRSKGAKDPDAAAILATPFLEDVEDNPDRIAEALGADRFQILLSTEASPPANGDGTGEQPPAAQEPVQSGFNGPSPANTGSGSQQMQAQQKIKVNSPEYRNLVAQNDEAALKKMYDEGLIEGSSRPW